MPAENDPADPNALTQSLQLTCSLTPSSTVPSTWLVIIWLKRAPARPPIDPALVPESVQRGGGPSASNVGPAAADVPIEVDVDVEHDTDCANATPGSPPRR